MSRRSCVGKFDDIPEDAPPRPARKIVPLRERSYPTVWLSEAELRLDAQPLLKGLIEPGAFCVVYGPPGSGKSFFTADIAQHIATGAPWRGRKVKQSLVVYIASEAGGSIVKRFVAWRDNRLGEASAIVPLAILTRGPNLLNLSEHEKLVEQLEILQTEAGLQLGLVIFDTLSRSIPGGDENSAEDITAAVSAADYIRDKLKAATIFVHHCGKDPAKGMRGHSALHAAADLVLLVEDCTATVEKVRDGVAGERFAFQLEPVEIGTDADGEAVVTCLLNHDSTARAAKRADPGGRNQKLILTAMRGLVADAGEPMPGTSAIPKGAKAVLFPALLTRVAPKFPDTPEWRVRQRLSDALMSLQASGHVGVHNEYLWLT